MRIIVDTNVVLDVLLAREPHAQAAAEIFRLAESSAIDAYLCATTVTTIDYLLGQALPRKDSKAALARLLSLFEIAPVNRAVLDRALSSGMADFEDAVLAVAGESVGAEAVVTRNGRDFAGSRLRILDPVEFLAAL